MKKMLASCFGIIGLAFISLLGIQGYAYALSCASGSTCVQELTNNNIDNGANIDIRVTVNNTVAGQTTITVTYESSNLGNALIGIDQFGYTSSVAATSASLSAIGWTQANCPVGGCTLDGFGKFASEIDRAGGTDSTFTFVLASQVTSFGDNTQGAEFAAHVRFVASPGFDSCSAFVSDGTANSTTANAGCSVVPEPATVLLVGTLLSGLGFFGRKKFVDTLKG
jgi:hypothetical protein